MSSLTKTPAQESASANSAMSVPASVGNTTSVVYLSVDEYHALQYKKRVDDKAAAPTDGSMPTDYGSDISDVPMEDGEVPSSAAGRVKRQMQFAKQLTQLAKFTVLKGFLILGRKSQIRYNLNRWRCSYRFRGMS
ncbi:hypothetical protein JG688_00009074 [Phytophthora aleatoria]|uniref:Uncharacterized protein n=1 Tax=Phytophthora aleatoria TaxID=2496075 RepID=A0A8J5M493_9STRA|nr:hypothetical protein JG688_00009074 [Phytophthora aleatoria]